MALKSFIISCTESGKREWVLTEVADNTQLGTKERKQAKIQEYSQSMSMHNLL